MKNILTDCIRHTRAYISLSEAVRASFRGKTHPIITSGLCDGAADATSVCLVEDTVDGRRSPVLMICSEEKECLRITQMAERFGIRSAFYISRDLNLHNISASHEFEHERLRVLSGILQGAYDLIVTTPETTLGYTMPPDVLISNTMKIDFDLKSEPSVLAQRLTDAGYARVGMVDGIGQFSVRGGIVDIYTPFGKFIDVDGVEHNGAASFRIEFWDDEIDRIDMFDIESQRSTIKLKSAEITPAREILVSEEARGRIEKAVKRAYDRNSNEKSDELLRAELATVRAAKSEINFADKYISLVYMEKCCLLDYFDGRTLTLIRGGAAVRDRLKSAQWQKDEDIKYMAEDGVICPEYAEYAKRSEDLTHFCDKNVTVHIDMHPTGLTDRELGGLFGFSTIQPVAYDEKLSLLCEDLKDHVASGTRVVVIADNLTAAKNLSEMLHEEGYSTAIEPEQGGYLISEIPQKTIYIVWRKYLFGYQILAPKIAILSTLPNSKSGSLNVSGKRKRYTKKISGTQSILSYNELEVGDYVVHEDYGIGRYLGIVNQKIGGSSRDYINIQYAGSDRLCIPVEKMNLISKYIGVRSEDGNVKLSKMGADSWKKAKARAKGSVKEMAKELVKLYAERMRRPGYAFEPDDEMQKNFEMEFDYEETQCQLDAIDDIKDDMMKPVPMDRLLCGDVGYGKTEVAFRAAYKAVLSGKQVAILVPTTILALQHYQTALNRMRDFAVNIDMVSRFRTTKQVERTLSRLERGDIDIIIGTHKLLGKGVKFADLGLLIVDEEQRFGVLQKEKLKQIAGNIDVLTLSATPIPRTMNMAMSGIRDISILDEAPGDRIPVQTYVLEDNDLIILEAIRKELRRGGQVFYLHNFVESIDGVAARLAREIPEARITVAHGQMDKEYLEEVWADMLEGRIDILVCTTIIETGIDVPNANTLIVDNAHRLGLSQLHQLRGRVGRSSRRAYAYFTFPRDKSITEIATKRLEAVREYAEFGAGFRIAMRDMEIRGAGNLLGVEQHGQLDSVGYDLYIRMLNDAVLEERGEHIAERVDCTVTIDCDAYLPECYVKFSNQRMALYKRIALIRTQADYEDIAEEIIDRYGDMPDVAENLLNVALLRAYAITIGLRQVTQLGNLVKMYQVEFDPFMWEAFSKMLGRDRVSVVRPANAEAYGCVKFKDGDNIMRIIKKMFEKYSESIQDLS